MRHQMDHSLRCLLTDIDLAQDERLKEYSHQARCDHLDKIYDWYVTHGMKEARKERPAPPYVRFSLNGPVMPGSLRVAPKTRESAASTPALAIGKGLARDSHAAGLGQSASLPTLTV